MDIIFKKREDVREYYLYISKITDDLFGEGTQMDEIIKAHKGHETKAMLVLLIGLILGDFQLIAEIWIGKIIPETDAVINPKDMEILKALNLLYKFISTPEKQFETKMTQESEIIFYTGNINAAADFFGDFTIKQLQQKFQKMEESKHEENRIKNAKKVLESKNLLRDFFKFLHASKYKGVMTKGYMFDTILGIIRQLRELSHETNPDFKLKYENLLESLTGLKLEKIADNTAKPLNVDERVQLMLQSLLQIYFPDLLKSYKLILKLVNLSFELSESTGNRMQMINKLEFLSKEIGFLFGVNPQEIHGIMGIIHGDYNALVRMTAPITKIDPFLIKKIMTLLRNANSALSDLKRRSGARDSKIMDEVVKDSWKEMMKKVNEGTAGIRVLFDLVDKEGG